MELLVVRPVAQHWHKATVAATVASAATTTITTAANSKQNRKNGLVQQPGTGLGT